MKVRIWIYWNDSPARITIRDSERVHLYRSEPTDEGYSYKGEDYYLSEDEPGVLVAEYHNGGSDCDGPIHWHTTCEWRIGGPVVPMVTWDWAGNCYDLPEMRPDWERVDSWKRDVFAEAAGY